MGAESDALPVFPNTIEESQRSQVPPRSRPNAYKSFPANRRRRPGKLKRRGIQVGMIRTIPFPVSRACSMSCAFCESFTGAPRFGAVLRQHPPPPASHALIEKRRLLAYPLIILASQAQSIGYRPCQKPHCLTWPMQARPSVLVDRTVTGSTTTIHAQTPYHSILRGRRQSE